MKVHLLAPVLLLLLAPSLSAQRPADGTFRVNVQRKPLQASPHVATNRAGEFVVVWADTRLGSPVDAAVLYARRFAPDGRPLTGEIRVIDRAMPFAFTSAVALLEDGSFAVAFNRWNDTPDGLGSSLKIRWFSPEGASQGEAVVAHGAWEFVSLSRVGEQGVVLAWSRNWGAGGPVQVRAFGPDRSPLKPRATLIDPTGVRAVVAGAPDGSFAVSWQDSGRETARLALRRFAPDGSPAGAAVGVTGSFPYGDSEGPLFQILAGTDGDGNLLLVWSPLFGPESPLGRWYAPDGAPLTRTFPISLGERHGAPNALAVGERGNFVLAWHRVSFADSQRDVFARRYARDGSPLGPAIQVNEEGQRAPGDDEQAGILADGGFVVIWTGSRQAGTVDILAQRFRRR